MAINETIISLITSILDGSKIGVYVNNIMLFLGGAAGVTLIYFTFMLYLNYKQYKEEKYQTELILKQKQKIDELYETINNKINK